MAHLIDASARGVFPISVTPFLDDGAIDFTSLDRLTDFFLQIGVPGLTLLGIMGEASRLSREESLGILRHVGRR
jgi:4-hydroxy-tetrahydrodipicolinate synthase